MFTQPSLVQFSLPSWLTDFSQSHGCIPDEQDRVRFVIEASLKNINEGTGGPFAAAVFERDSGKLVALGVNLVTSQGLSLLHAEMVAFALAQKKLGHYDLGSAELPAHELVCSTEPCAMCFGAIFWSGVRRVVCAAQDADARRVGFDEGPKLPDWQQALISRGIEVVTGLEKERAAAALNQYAARGGCIYNSRGAG